jgi:cation diffusion facilitator CzcD-associated flavoprotein CzcO
VTRRNNISRRELLSYGLSLGGVLLPALGTQVFADTSTDPVEESSTDLLIIGAGPFGLALAAFAQENNINHQVVGVPMGFWRDHMPDGMLLRSTCDWSLDPMGIHTIDAYLSKLGKQCAEVEPLSRGFYLDYARWFQEQKAIESEDWTVSSLISDGAELVAAFADGRRIRSRNVVLAIGFSNFYHVPPRLAPMFPADQSGHTCNLVDFGRLKDRRVLIIGGRQSAFEWTALIREAGAEAVYTSYRHDTPLFETADWSWVNGIVNQMSTDPGWYRRLTPTEKEQLNRRFWQEGRLKLEPWLASRIDHPNIHLYPNTEVIGTHQRNHDIEVTLTSGETLTVDEVIYATGYKVDLQRVAFLDNGRLPGLEIQDGYTSLDVHFQTGVPGLFITSLAATRDFGSFLAFTVSARAQAQIIGEAVQARLGSSIIKLASRGAW